MRIITISDECHITICASYTAILFASMRCALANHVHHHIQNTIFVTDLIKTHIYFAISPSFFPSYLFPSHFPSSSIFNLYVYICASSKKSDFFLTKKGVNVGTERRNQAP